MTQSWAVPLSDLVVDDELADAATEAVRSGWWSMGPRVEEFEAAFASFSGARHAFAVANGTAALHLALLAIGCGAGDEVVVPSLNFVAAANTIRLVGATPVFCDVRGEHDLNLDPRDVDAALGPRTKAILALHYAGVPCDVDAVLALGRGRRVLVVEDDDEIAQVLQRSLRLDGYEVRLAADGEAALDAAAAYRPDLVILDLGLPGLDGMEVARRLRAADDVPILGPVAGLDGLVLATGFSGHGFQLSPMIGQTIAELITEGAPSIPIDALHLARFAA